MIKPTFNRTTRRLTLTAGTSAADQRALAAMSQELGQRGVHFTTDGARILHLPLVTTAFLEAAAVFVDEVKA